MNTEPTSPPSGLASPSCYASSCGRVTLYLGDCRDIIPILGKVDALISDPPYGTGMEHGRRDKRPKQKDGNLWGNQWGAMDGDKATPTLDHLDLSCAVIWGANYFPLPTGNKWLVWEKGTDPKWSASDAELAWTSVRGGGVASKSIYWTGFRREQEIREHYHPTQKPVSLMAWCMEQAKVPAGALVLDPYMGSGSTGIACIRTGRRFVGIEKDPSHYATALKRITNELAQGDLFLGHNRELSRCGKRHEIRFSLSSH